MMKSTNNCNTAAPLLGKIKLCSELGPFLSDNRMQLLHTIHQHGSLRAAACTLSLSYKAAWDALDSMNNLADQPLVSRTTGSSNGDGAALTPYALRLVAMYKALELEYQSAFAPIEPALASPSRSDCDSEISHFRHLMRRMNFRSSARNQLMGVVSSITQGHVNALVSLSISPQLTITAMISSKSVAELNLSIGCEVLALLKASQITISQQATATTELINQFSGKLTQRCEGKIYTDLCIELADSKSLNAIVPNEMVSSLGLQNDRSLHLSFLASSVILCHYC